MTKFVLTLYHFWVTFGLSEAPGFLGGALLAAPVGVASDCFVFSAEGAMQDSLGQAKGRCRPVARP
jgi:hypothetical protein